MHTNVFVQQLQHVTWIDMDQGVYHNIHSRFQ